MNLGMVGTMPTVVCLVNPVKRERIVVVTVTDGLLGSEDIRGGRTAATASPRSTANMAKTSD